MKRETIRRFTGPELWLHWSHAVLYLTLFASGTLLLVGRILDRWLVSREILASLHRIAGIALVALLAEMLLLSVVAQPFRCFWRTLGQCLRWRWSDVVWLVKVPFNTITKRVTLPPADRFNAGQKIHLLVLVSALAGFSISGLLIMLVPGAIAPWIIHLICFIPAAAFLALHLFLSLLNPETRKALSSIFTGQMPLDLARRHHGLWAGRSETQEHSSYVSLRVVLITAALLLVAGAALVGRYGPKRAYSVLSTTIAQQGTNAISPAPLSRAHADENSGIQQCAGCHLLTASPPSTKCLICHTDIGERMTARSGFHGTLSGPCRQCHPEHKGAEAALISLDRRTFNHGSANFPLDGRHQAVPCENCHERKAGPEAPARMQFIGLDHTSCTSCHEDPHGHARAADCRRCHTMQGWRRGTLTFDHGRDSEFALVGRHARLDCQKCHSRRMAEGQARVILFDIGKSCRDCHADPHGGQFTAGCRHCHTEQGWTGSRPGQFHGPNSSFPLKGKHMDLRCEECHRIPAGSTRLADAKFAGLGKDCQSCHDDPHAGQMSSTCRTCHTEASWTGNGLVFSHAQHTSFPFDRLHSTVACAACHGRREKRYRPLPHDCGACHTTQQDAMRGVSTVLTGSPDPHNGRLSCTDCHDVTRARQSQEEFAVRCATCHGPAYRGLFYSWASALGERRASIRQRLNEIEDPNDARRLHYERVLQDTAAAGFHNLDLTREMLRGELPVPAENPR